MRDKNVYREKGHNKLSDLTDYDYIYWNHIETRIQTYYEIATNFLPNY